METISSESVEAVGFDVFLYGFELVIQPNHIEIAIFGRYNFCVEQLVREWNASRDGGTYGIYR